MNIKSRSQPEDLPADGKTTQKLVAEGLALSHGAEATVCNTLGIELREQKKGMRPSTVDENESNFRSIVDIHSNTRTFIRHTCVAE